MSNKPKVSVIGVGRLGLSFALLLNSKGYDVMGCDVNEKYIQSLKDRTFTSNEPHISELVQYSTVDFTTNTLEALNYADLIFVFVQTPSKEGGNYSHKYVDQVVNKIINNHVTYKTLVIGCTVMPYYCESIQKKLFKQQIDVVYNPEFIAQGSIISGLENADIVLMGGEMINGSLYSIYADIMKKAPNFKVLSWTGAEIAKISINCFLSMKIAFANMVGEIVINSHEQNNIAEIMEAIGSDSRIGEKYLSYGFPAGGVCLPRDQKALNHHAYAVGVPTKFTHAIDDENNRHLEYLERYYTSQNPNKEVPFIFSYLSYKKGVDILTGSYQLELCIRLLRDGYKVDVPVNVKDMNTPEEFKDYFYEDMVTFGEIKEGYKIN